MIDASEMATSLGPIDEEALQFAADTLIDTTILEEQPSRPKPTKEFVMEAKDRLYRYWQPRNERFEEDQKLYELYDKTDRGNNDWNNVGRESLSKIGETIILNDPYVLVEKLANMLSSQEPTVSVPVRDPAAKQFSQRTEDFLKWWRETAARRWLNTLHGPLTRDEAHYLCVRGWITGRISWNPEDTSFPWDYQLFDPVNVYPQVGRRGLEYVIHYYKATLGEVRADFGNSPELLKKIDLALTPKGKKNARKKNTTIDLDEEVEVVGYYDDEWYALYVNDNEVRTDPHMYGFVPWVIVTANGSPIRQTPWDKTNYVRRIGTSVFEGMRGVYQKLNRLVSAIATEVSKIPNPAGIVYTDELGVTQAKEVDTSPGATNTLILDREKYQVLETNRQAIELSQPLLQILQDRLNRSTLPPVLWGEGANTLSGFAVSLLSAGARDVVYPLVRGIEGYRAVLHEDVLKLYAKFGDQLEQPVEMIATVRSGEEGGVRRAAIVYKPEEVNESGTYNEVTYRSLAPQDRAAMANIAAMLVREQIIDRETARGDEFLGLENPSLINEKVIGEMVLSDPEVIKLLIPFALQKTDPVMYLAYLQAEQQKLLQAMDQMRQHGMGMGSNPNAQMYPEILPNALNGKAPPAPEGAPENAVPLG
jgi:hypothetical protein